MNLDCYRNDSIMRAARFIRNTQVKAITTCDYADTKS